MYLLIIFLPVLSSFLLGLFGNFLGKYYSSLIALFLIFSSFCCSLFCFYEVLLCNSIVNISLFKWFDVGIFSLNWGFFFDSLTCSMLIIVLSVSFLVHMYSLNYMGEDPHLIRFLCYLSFFTSFMVFLVTADNFLQLFLGWEGVGLASYLLINFWFTRLAANKAALKAVIVNRVGDFGVSVAIVVLFVYFQSFDFLTVFSLVPFFLEETVRLFGFSISLVSFVSFFLFLGAVGKSAQLGLHTWLPDAMEGPTPVSALIHAATMVTAGVFLLLRCSPLLEYSPAVLGLITIIGALTAFFAATVGLFQFDLKKIIAYSTCSQLGYMIFAIGVSGYSISLFHLMNHAFFKALLFLSAGSVIHALNDEQDMRKMGGIAFFMPYTYTMFLIGSLSLMGFPFLTGFYSKDLILEYAYSTYSLSGHFAFWLGSVSAFCTALYSFRLIYLTFFNSYLGSRSILPYIHDAPFLMGFPLFLLCLGSIFFGFLFKDLIVGLGSPVWSNTFFFEPTTSCIFEFEFLPFYIKIIPFCFSICGVFMFYFLFFFLRNYSFKRSFLSRSLLLLLKILNQKWRFDIFYSNFVVQNYLKFGYFFTFKLVDRGVLELLGPLSIVRFFLVEALFCQKFKQGFFIITFSLFLYFFFYYCFF